MGPSSSRHRTCALAVAANLSLFVVTYFSAGWWAENHHAFAVSLPGEDHIPLINWMIVPYVSFFSVFITPWIVLPAGEVRRLSRMVLTATLVATACFVAFPTVNAFPYQHPDTLFAPLFTMVKTLDVPYNMVPSLHVAWGTLIFWVTRPYLRTPAGGALWTLWIGLIIVSTVFTHQHHLLDVVTGVLLAVAILRFQGLQAPARLPSGLD